jgi:hypothetical protein
VDTPYSPSWWTKKLTSIQTKKLPRLNELAAWLDNDPPLPKGAAAWEAAYQSFYKDTRTGIAPLAVSSAAHRMTNLGCRTAATDDDNGDKVAARIMARNRWPVEQVTLFTYMLGLSEGYTMVGPPASGSDNPILTVEDPRQIVTVNDPVNPMLTRAGIKTYHDPFEEQDVLCLYLPPDPLHHPTKVSAYKAIRKAANGTNWGANFRYLSRYWDWQEVEYFPISRVPITRYENRGGVAEFEPHLGLLRRYNRITLQRMVIGEIQAFRQRAIEGLPDIYPADYAVIELRGKKIDYEGIFTPGPGSLWKVPPGAKFWESQPIDLTPLLNEEKMEQRTASALMGFPVSMFSPDDTNGSAEGASLQRESLVFRVEDRITIASTGVIDTMSHAFEAIEDADRADVDQIEPLWAPIERLSLTERYQAAVQARAAGSSVAEVRREVLKYTPRQMEQAEDDDIEEMLKNPPPRPEPMQVSSQRQDQQQPARQTVPALPAGR